MRAVPETPLPQEPCYSPDLAASNGMRRRLRDTQARATRWQQSSSGLRVNPVAAATMAGSVGSPSIANLNSAVMPKKKSKESDRTGGTDNQVKTPLESIEIAAADKNEDADGHDGLDRLDFEAKSPKNEDKNEDDDEPMQPLEASPALTLKSQSKSSRVPELVKLP